MLFYVVLGRIHSAVISGINLEAGSVTVEWLEKNEIKGKEACISFSAHCSDGSAPSSIGNLTALLID